MPMSVPPRENLRIDEDTHPPASRLVRWTEITSSGPGRKTLACNRD
jgi:hypothetical protein